MQPVLKPKNDIGEFEEEFSNALRKAGLEAWLNTSLRGIRFLFYTEHGMRREHLEGMIESLQLCSSEEQGGLCALELFVNIPYLGPNRLRCLRFRPHRSSWMAVTDPSEGEPQEFTGDLLLPDPPRRVIKA